MVLGIVVLLQDPGALGNSSENLEQLKPLEAKIIVLMDLSENEAVDSS